MIHFLIDLLFSIVFTEGVTLRITVYCKENHLRYGYSCGLSNPGFWKDRLGTVYINTIAKRCIFKDSLDLAISDTILNQMEKSREIYSCLRSTEPLLAQGTFLRNFASVEGKEKKTAKK